jgi:protein-tyrosine phosphatase
MTSANAHADAPCCSGEHVLERFGDAEALALVVDGGPSRLCEASAVLRVGPGAFDLLRPGLFTIEELRATAGLAIAFACTGNTCRSPMAEGLARAALAARLEVAPERIGEFGFQVFSMGVAAGAGSPAAAHAVAVLALSGIDLSRHRSRPALAGDVERADRVYGLTRAHVDALRMALPPGRATHVELLDPDGADVPDPIGGSRDDYLRCARHIERLVERRLDEWA